MTPKAFARTTATLGFVHNRLDRLANARDDTAFIDNLRGDRAARVAVFVQDEVLVRGAGRENDPWFGFAEADTFGIPAETVFLGRDEAGPAFAVRLDALPEGQLGQTDLSPANLRTLAIDGSVSADDLGVLAQAKAVLHWHRSHRFCAACGAPSASSGAGWRRECATCGTHHFPRTDPVVIMLAVDGERCLMGRQARFPPLMYSCLAGFLEPGETIEAAVAREIAEEAGIAVDAVTYLGAQPWPFPASLMIGCLAQASTTAITIDPHELEDARWFSREEALAMLEGRHPEGLICPVPMAIAHHILRTWVEAA